MRKDRLVKKLQNNERVEVQFTRDDGSPRIMYATLAEQIVSEQPEHPMGLVTAWDLEKDNWRNIRLNTVSSVIPC